MAASLLFLAGCATASSVPRNTVVAPDSATLARIAGERGLADSAVVSSAIGVTPFRTTSRDASMTALGYALADLITTDLARSSQLQLVERSRLGDVLRELDLAKSGRIDSATAPRVGKLIRASRLVIGSVDSIPGGEVRVGLRLADVQTGELQQALDARAPVADILAAQKAIVFRLFTALGVALTPAEQAIIESRPATSLATLTAFGRGVEAELLGDLRRAREQFERSLGFDPNFQPASERIAELRSSADGSAAPSLLPSVRGIGGAVSGTVDRLNRPLDFITAFTKPSGGPGDPSFPSTVVTVLLTVRRP